MGNNKICLLPAMPVAPTILEVAWEKILPDPNQPRRTFMPEELEGLANSIRVKGVLQPLRVAVLDVTEGTYRLIAGERRLRACQLAGRKTVPVLVVPGELSAGETLIEQLIENLQRDSVPPLETAEAMERLRLLQNFSASQVAETLGLHVSTVTKYLALNRLPEWVRGLVADGKLCWASAYEISKLPDDRDRLRLAERAVAEGWSRDQVARAVSALARPQSEERPAKRPRRVICRRPSGAVITVAGTESGLTWDSFFSELEALLREARKLRTSGAGIEELPKRLGGVAKPQSVPA